MSSRNGNHATPNAPNPEKFLKEMATLVPLLKKKGIIPMTREEARAAGERGTQAAAMNAQIEHQRRMDIIGRRLDEYIAELAPWTFKAIVKTGWSWLIPFMGYSYKVEATKETVEGCPNIQCTRVYVLHSWFRWWPKKVVKAERLVWQEPKKPKSRIIKP